MHSGLIGGLQFTGYLRPFGRVYALRETDGNGRIEPWRRAATTPVALGVLGLAAGALLVALVPQSDQEEAALEGIAKQARDTATSVANQSIEGGKHVAQAVADRARESAQGHGPAGARHPVNWSTPHSQVSWPAMPRRSSRTCCAPERKPFARKHLRWAVRPTHPPPIRQLRAHEQAVTAETSARQQARKDDGIRPLSQGLGGIIGGAGAARRSRAYYTVSGRLTPLGGIPPTRRG